MGKYALLNATGRIGVWDLVTVLRITCPIWEQSQPQSKYSLSRLRFETRTSRSVSEWANLLYHHNHYVWLFHRFFQSDLSRQCDIVIPLPHSLMPSSSCLRLLPRHTLNYMVMNTLNGGVTKNVHPLFDKSSGLFYVSFSATVLSIIVPSHLLRRVAFAHTSYLHSSPHGPQKSKCLHSGLITRAE